MLDSLDHQEQFSLDHEGDQTQGADSNLCCISQPAVSGAEGPKTIHLQGDIQKKEVLMLVDLGSTHSFVGANFAQQLAKMQQSMDPIRVHVANERILNVTRRLGDVNGLGKEFSFV